MQKVMKNIFLILIISSSVIAQVEFQVIDSVTDEFKIKYSEDKHEYNPLHVGDLWQYYNFQEEYYTHRTISKDTLINGIRYCTIIWFCNI